MLARKTSETKGPGRPRSVAAEEGQWHARYSILWGIAKKYRGNATVLGGRFETSRLLLLATITTVPRVLRLLYIALWLHWSHWNAVKTMKNRYIPCSVTVTTLHRQLVSRARAYGPWECAHARALLETRRSRAKSLPELNVCTRVHIHLSLNRCCSVSSSLTSVDREGCYSRSVHYERASIVCTMKN